MNVNTNTKCKSTIVQCNYETSVNIQLHKLALTKNEVKDLIIRIITIIITMFTQGNLFNIRGAVINEGPISITAINYNKMNFKQRNKINM